MNHHNFYFWLQGYFELLEETPDNESLTNRQISCIDKHLDLVVKVDGELKGTAAYIRGMIHAYEIANAEDGGFPNRYRFTLAIRDKLNSCFKHEVDPVYDLNDPEKKDELDQAHNGGFNPGGGFGPLIRC